MTSAGYLQQRASDAWPALEVVRLGGWLLRGGCGVTKRANSVLALRDPGRPVADAVAAVEQWYAARSIPPRFQTFAGQSPADLDERLADAGYARSEETVFMTAPLAAVSAPMSAQSREERCRNREGAAGVELTEDPTDEWLAAFDLAEPTPWDREGRGALLRRRTPPRRHAAVRLDGRIVAVGRCVVDDGWAGFAAVATAADHRRQGHALAVMSALTAWALRAGARSAYLQVLAGNQPAQSLYRSLGFTEHHRYAYHARPAGQTEKK